MSTLASPTTASKYDSWTRDELIARLVQLEPRVARAESREGRVQKRAALSAQRMHTAAVVGARRKIALRFCYAGAHYNGLAFQTEPTPLPTVEAVLFEALAKTRLIDPAAGFEGCEWARCGRTDCGVSATGQVVSLWVRSALKKPDESDGAWMPHGQASDSAGPQALSATVVDVQDLHPDEAARTAEPALVEEQPEGLDPDDIGGPSETVPPRKEFAYVAMLNRVLPDTIRIIAWSPVAASFSARFSCRSRHYKYFFAPGGLDLDLIRTAAADLVGEHDFRAFSKLDAAKQITNFRRTISRADLTLVDGGALAVLDLVGSAFLWHQVRHIMAVLFLVGARAEPPGVVRALLAADTKPEYEMASAGPLVLWDCAYADADVAWRAGEDGAAAGHLRRHLAATAEVARVDAALAELFLRAAEPLHPPHVPAQRAVETVLGAGRVRKTAKYVPLMQRKRMEHFEVLNERWRTGKGARRTVLREAAKAQQADDEDE